MADYLKLNLSDISSTITTTQNLIDALGEQKSATTQLKTCLETDNAGKWARGASSKLGEVEKQIDTTLTALIAFNAIQKDYLNGLEEKTGATGEIEIDASHYRWGLEQIRSQIDVIQNQGGWETALFAALPGGMLDLVDMLVEQEKARGNAKILASIMGEVKPAYLSKLYTSLNNLETTLTNDIEPLMSFDEEIATRTRTAYEDAVSPLTKTGIFLGDAARARMSAGKGIGDWATDTASGILEFLMNSSETVDSLINEAAGVLNWLMSGGAVLLGGIFKYDETFYKQLLSDIREGDVSRYDFGDKLEYPFTQGLKESANEKGFAYTLGNIVPEVALIFIPAAKAAQATKVASRGAVRGITGSSGSKVPNSKPDAGAPKTTPVPGYERITSIKSIKDLPQDVQEVYRGYSNHGWRGNFPGQAPTATGGVWRNSPTQLPSYDANGNSIFYREWDIDARVPGGTRSARRFVTGSDGSAYYTDDHYSTFIKIEEGK